MTWARTAPVTWPAVTGSRTEAIVPKPAGADRLRGGMEGEQHEQRKKSKHLWDATGMAWRRSMQCVVTRNGPEPVSYTHLTLPTN